MVPPSPSRFEINDYLSSRQTKTPRNSKKVFGLNSSRSMGFDPATRGLIEVRISQGLDGERVELLFRRESIVPKIHRLIQVHPQGS